MLFRTLADLVVLVHLAFIVFVVLGGVLALRWRWMPWVHLPAVVWSALLEFRGWICPLTPLENWLRRAGGGSAYSGGFVEQYVVPIVYPTALTHRGHAALGILLCVINIAVYARWWCSTSQTRGRRNVP